MSVADSPIFFGIKRLGDTPCRAVPVACRVVEGKYFEGCQSFIGAVFIVMGAAVNRCTIYQHGGIGVVVG